MKLQDSEPGPKHRDQWGRPPGLRGTPSSRRRNNRVSLSQSAPSSPPWGTRFRPLTNFFQLNLPCYQRLAVLLPRLHTHLRATFESGKELRESQSSESNLLASKRCFLGGTDTSGGVETLRQLSGLLTDGGRRKKRKIDFALPKHIGIRARVEYGFQRIKHRIGERGAMQRHQP